MNLTELRATLKFRFPELDSASPIEHEESITTGWKKIPLIWIRVSSGPNQTKATTVTIPGESEVGKLLRGKGTFTLEYLDEKISGESRLKSLRSSMASLTVRATSVSADKKRQRMLERGKLAREAYLIGVRLFNTEYKLRRPNGDISTFTSHLYAESATALKKMVTRRGLKEIAVQAQPHQPTTWSVVKAGDKINAIHYLMHIAWMYDTATGQRNGLFSDVGPFHEYIHSLDPSNSVDMAWVEKRIQAVEEFLGLRPLYESKELK